MKHLFLTGEVGVGKTTLLNRLLPSGLPPCGFVTKRTETDQGTGVYLHDPALTRHCGKDNCVGSLENGIMYPHPEIFETVGVALLSRLPHGRLIVMDELGVLEQDAPLFCTSVLKLLDGTRPVLGVVKDKHSVFLDAVRSHPNVEVIRVSEQNREELYSRLKERT